MASSSAATPPYRPRDIVLQCLLDYVLFLLALGTGRFRGVTGTAEVENPVVIPPGIFTGHLTAKFDKINQESHLSTKSKVVAAIAGAALVPFAYIVTLPLIAILLGTEPKNVAAKSMVAGLLSLGIWVCLLVIIGVSLRKRQPGLARYLVVGAFLGMAVFVSLPFLELALGVAIFP